MRVDKGGVGGWRLWCVASREGSALGAAALAAVVGVVPREAADGAGVAGTVPAAGGDGAEAGALGVVHAVAAAVFADEEVSTVHTDAAHVVRVGVGGGGGGGGGEG